MPNNPAAKLRGKKLPRDVWDFLDSNVPTLIIKVLHRYVEEVEKENDQLRRMWSTTADLLNMLEERVFALEDEIVRLKGERVQTRPTNTVAGSKLQKERPAPARRWRSHRYYREGH